jgi:TonB family protein
MNPLRMKRLKPFARIHSSLSLSCAALAAYIGACACASHAETEVKGPVLVAHASPLLGEPESDESLARAEPAPAPRKQRRRGLDSYQISEVVRSGYLAFGGCQALADGAQGREGVVTVDWLVRPDGSVSNVTVVDSSYQSAQVDDCVAAVAKGLRFPEADGSTRVAWKVRFQALSASR